MRSTGLPCDQLEGSTRRSSSTVAAESSASARPKSAARAGAMTPGPPPFADTAYALDVERDVRGLRVGRQIVDDLAEVYVGRTAEGHDAREPPLVGRRPVEHRGAYRTRLRHQAERPGERRAACESGVQSDR